MSVHCAMEADAGAAVTRGVTAAATTSPATVKARFNTQNLSLALPTSVMVMAGMRLDLTKQFASVFE
ncbi:hypothetical protein C3489_15380 [Streptomyces sp. Ru71]|nr:hypothetical protein C3489_15380 [Streptomyces sp. Ru71]